MKKKFLVTITALMVLAMSSMTCFAASAVTDATKSIAANTQVSSGYAVSPVSSDVAKVANEAATQIAPGSTVATVVEIDPTTAKVGADNQYHFAIAASTIKADGSYVVLHLNSTSHKWEKVTVEGVADGSIAIASPSLSPIAVIAVNTNTANNTTNSTAKSPKTGETMPVAATLIVVGLAGAALCTKKAFA